MARRLIDGMVVDVADEDAPLVGVDIEDVLYEDQESAGTVDVFTPQEYEEAATEYNRAQKLLTLFQCAGFSELIGTLQSNANHHAENDRRYTALDITKIQGLRMNRIAADYAFKFVTDLLDTAKQTPRPILKS